MQVQDPSKAERARFKVSPDLTIYLPPLREEFFLGGGGGGSMFVFVLARGRREISSGCTSPLDTDTFAVNQYVSLT